jgi:hypothetical protein
MVQRLIAAPYAHMFTLIPDAISDSASFAAAFKRMRAAGKESQSGTAAPDYHEPTNSDGPVLPLQVQESDTSAALQLQLQVIFVFAQPSSCALCNATQAIRARAQADHVGWSTAPASSISPMAPVVLQASPFSNTSTTVPLSVASVVESTYSPAVELRTPSSPVDLQPHAAETVYRLHRVSPYRYVDTPNANRFPMFCNFCELLA